MNAVNILIAILGSGITLMVVVGIAFLTPHGTEAHLETPDLSSPPPPEGAVPAPEGSRRPAAVSSMNDATDGA